MSWGRSRARVKGYQKTEVEPGVSVASKLEAAVLQILRLREKAGELEVLALQDKVYLTDARILYIADFKCRDLRNDSTFWVEAKGFKTEVWAIKKRLWYYYGPGRLEIWEGRWESPRLTETIHR